MLDLVAMDIAVKRENHLANSANGADVDMTQEEMQAIIERNKQRKNANNQE
jgi:hypothetical protein